MTTRRNWTTEEYRRYLATGWRPDDPLAPKPKPVAEPRAPSNKYGARRTERDGHRFDSLVEAARYEALKADPAVAWIDVHPVVTLPGAVRFKADFLVTYRDGRRELEDVKGARPRTDFWRLKQLLDAVHPLRPLVVVRRRRGRWIRIERREDWEAA